MNDMHFYCFSTTFSDLKSEPQNDRTQDRTGNCIMKTQANFLDLIALIQRKTSVLACWCLCASSCHRVTFKPRHWIKANVFSIYSSCNY